MSGCVLREEEKYGLKLIIMENDLLYITILPEKGMDIQDLIYKPSQVNFLSKHAKCRERLKEYNSFGMGTGDYGRFFQGGWQDIIPSRLCVDGEISDTFSSAALLPWKTEVIQNSPNELKVSGKVFLHDSGLEIEKTFSISEKEPLLKIDEKITKTTDGCAEFTWTHHPAFGGDLPDESLVVGLPECKVVDYLSFDRDKTASRLYEYEKSKVRHGYGFIDIERYRLNYGDKGMFYTLKELKEGRVRQYSFRKKLGFELTWDIQAFPNLWFWAENNSDIRTIALEPSTTCFPDFQNAKKSCMTLNLKKGESISTWLEFKVI